MQGLVDLLKQCEIIEAEENTGEEGISKKKQGKKAQEETQYEGLLSLPEVSGTNLKEGDEESTSVPKEA